MKLSYMTLAVSLVICASSLAGPMRAELATSETPAPTESDQPDAKKPAAAPGPGAAGAGIAQVSSRREPLKNHFDAELGFRLRYPAGFVLRAQDVSSLRQFTPAPVASLFFMNPTMAAGDLAGREPPDLELRVYRAENAPSLRDWLTSAGFAGKDGGPAEKPYQNGKVHGLELCQPTLMAPGCSVFVMGQGRVYQMTPMSREGESIMRSFELLP